jgi:hypothetical protein
LLLGYRKRRHLAAQHKRARGALLLGLPCSLNPFLHETPSHINLGVFFFPPLVPVCVVELHPAPVMQQ